MKFEIQNFLNMTKKKKYIKKCEKIQRTDNFQTKHDSRGVFQLCDCSNEFNAYSLILEKKK